jgi:hypothetical protein
MVSLASEQLVEDQIKVDQGLAANQPPRIDEPTARGLLVRRRSEPGLARGREGAVQCAGRAPVDAVECRNEPGCF